MGQNQEMMAAQDLYGQQNRAAYQQFSDQNIYQGNLDAQNSFLPQEYQSTLRSGLPSGFEDYSGIRAGSSAFGGELGGLASPVLGPLGEAAGRAFDAGSAGMVSRGLDYLGLPTAPQLGRAVGEGIGPAIGSLPGQSLPTGENWADVAALGFGVPGVPSLLGEAAGPLIRGGLEAAGPLLKGIIPEVKFGEQPFFANLGKSGGLNPDSESYLNELQRSLAGEKPINPGGVMSRGEAFAKGLIDNLDPTAPQRAAGEVRTELPGYTTPEDVARAKSLGAKDEFFYTTPKFTEDAGHPIGTEPVMPSGYRPEPPPEIPSTSLPPNSVANIPPMADVNSALTSRLDELASNRVSGLLPESTSSVRAAPGYAQGEGFTMEPSPWMGPNQRGVNVGREFNPAANDPGLGQFNPGANDPGRGAFGPGGMPPPPTGRGGLGGSYEGGGLPPLKDMPEQSISQILWNGAMELLNAPRAFQAGGDLSYALRQMIYLAPSHLPEWAAAVPRGLRSVVDPEYAARVAEKIAASPYASVKSKLFLPPADSSHIPMALRDEQYVGSGLASKVPGYGRLYSATERGNTTMLNSFKSDIADTWIENYISSRGGTLTPDGKIVNEAGKVLSGAQREIDDYMRYLNRGTGRGTLGGMEKSLPLGQALFSPLNTVAKPQTLATLWREPFSPVWNQAAKDLVSFVTMGTTTLGAASLLGEKVGVDWRNADFGKIVDGKTHIDVWGGWQQPVRALIQAAAGSGYLGDDRNRADQFGRTKNVSTLDVGLEFLANRLSPQAAVGGQIAVGELEQKIRDSGHDDVADKLRILFPENRAISPQESWKFLAPFYLQDAIDAFKQEGLGRSLEVGGSSFFGLGTQTYSQGGPAGDARDQILSNPQALSQAFPDNPKVAEGIQGRPYVMLLGNEKQAINDSLPPEAKAALDAEAEKKRAAGDPFQKVSDLYDAREQELISTRQSYDPAFAQLQQRLFSGQGDPHAIEQTISQLRRDESAHVKMIYDDYAKNIKTITDSKEYQRAMAQSYDKTDIQETLTAYSSLYNRPSMQKAEGGIDFDKYTRAQQAFLSTLDETTAARIVEATKKDDSDKPKVLQFYDSVVRPVADEYFKIKEDGAKQEYLRTHPDQEAILKVAGYGGGYPYKVHSQQAADYIHRLAPNAPVEVR